MKLTIGSIKLTKSNAAQIESTEGKLVSQFQIDDLVNSQFKAELRSYLIEIDEVVIGFADLQAIDFLRLLPNTEKIWLMTPTIKNIDGLVHLKKLKSLTIDRPTCHFDILGELKTLEDIYLDDWRPGITSIFNLTNLRDVGLQKWGYPNLKAMKNWQKVNKLWLNRGKLEEVDGIPSGIIDLEISNMRKLKTITSLSNCKNLSRLVIQSCKKINSLNGIQEATELKFLSIAKGGRLDNLNALENLQSLEHIFLADGTSIEGSVDALYSLPNLKRIVISRKSKFDRNRFLKNHPDTEVILAT